MRRTIYLLVLFLFIVFVYSCQDELIEPQLEHNETKELTKNSSQDEILKATSQIIAQIQNVDGIKPLFKKEASKLTGGEKTVLYTAVKNQVLENSEQTLAELMATKAQELGFQVSKGFFASELSMIIPKLSFTLFLHDTDDITKWDVNTTFVAVPETQAFQSLETSEETGFGANGEELLVNNQDEPTFNALVIENNGSFLHLDKKPTIESLSKLLETLNIIPCEDMINEILESINSKSKDYLVYVDSDNWFLDVNNILLKYNDCYVTPSRSNNNYRNDRDSREEREEVKAARVDHSELKKFCKWWKSSCKIEVQLTFFELNSQGNISPSSLPVKNIIEDRSDMKKHRVFWSDLQMYRWEHTQGSQNHGDKCIYTLVGKHHSPGNTTTFTFNASTGQVKFEQNGLTVTSPGFSGGISHTRTTSDLELGGDMVYYSDPANGVGTMYTSGSMDFWVKEHE